MVNYANGKIYMISPVNAIEGDGNIYIGSTTKEYLSQRMVCHRKDYVQWKNGNIKVGKINSFDIFDTFGVDYCRIILLETFPCQSRDELTSREAFYIRSMPNVNKIVPHRTRAQYREDNHEDILQKQNGYYKINKDSINKRRRECGNVICECGSSILRRNVLQHIKTQKHIYALSAIGDPVVGADLI
jgi:ribosomal protein S27AE